MTTALLVTGKTPAFFAPGRTPLRRLRLPIQMRDQWLSTKARRLWWLEGDGHYSYLRACCAVSRWYQEGEGTQAALVLELDEGSYRTTWTIGPTAARGRVGWALSPGFLRLDEPKEKELAAVAATLPRQCSPRGAARYFESLWRRTASERGPAAVNTLSQARRCIIGSFSTAELPMIADSDPIELSSELLSDLIGLRVGGPIEMPVLTELTQEGLTQSELAEPVKRVHHLEVATSRHQFVLELLTQRLRQHNLCPTANRLIDLAVSSSSTDYFFELKTTSEPLRVRARTAAAQLLEYKFRHLSRLPDRKVRLAAVLEANSPLSEISYAERFLESVNIGLVLWRDPLFRFDGLSKFLTAAKSFADEASIGRLPL